MISMSSSKNIFQGISLMQIWDENSHSPASDFTYSDLNE